MSLLNNIHENKTVDNKVTEDVMDRIKQIIDDTGYGKVFIYIVNHEVEKIEHSVTKVFKKDMKPVKSLKRNRKVLSV